MDNHFNTIKVDWEESRVVVHCIQKIIDIENDTLLWEVEMNQILNRLEKRILIIDFANVDILASSAIQFLIRLLFDSRDTGLQFGLCGFQANVLNTLKNTCLTELLIIENTVDQITSRLKNKKR